MWRVFDLRGLPAFILFVCSGLDCGHPWRRADDSSTSGLYESLRLGSWEGAKGADFVSSGLLGISTLTHWNMSNFDRFSTAWTHEVGVHSMSDMVLYLELWATKWIGDIWATAKKHRQYQICTARTLVHWFKEIFGNRSEILFSHLFQEFACPRALLRRRRIWLICFAALQLRLGSWIYPILHLRKWELAVGSSDVVSPPYVFALLLSVSAICTVYILVARNPTFAIAMPYMNIER